MQEESDNGDGVVTLKEPCKFKVGDWVKMRAASEKLLRFTFMTKDDLGIVTEIKAVPATYRKEAHYLITVYWQNTKHRKSGNSVKLMEKRIKHAKRYRRSQD